MLSEVIIHFLPKKPPVNKGVMPCMAPAPAELTAVAELSFACLESVWPTEAQC